MSTFSKNKFWKSNSSHVPGSLKAVYGSHSFDETNKDWRNNDAITELASDDAPLELSLEQVRITAMDVINKHKIQLEQEKLAASQPNKVELKPNHFILKEQLSKSEKTTIPRDKPVANKQRANGRTTFPGRGVRSVTNSLSFKDRELFQECESARSNKLQKIMKSDNFTLQELKELCWSGIPQPCRGTAWKLLSSYLPTTPDRRQQILDRKRKEYCNLVSQYYATRTDAIHYETYHQIHIDIPRMSPLIPLFQQKIVQEIFERILYIWAIRHPASGYVQGINDLVTPYFVVFLSEHLEKGTEISNYAVGSLPEKVLMEIEADSFWCFSKLLDGIQDNYTFAQPGIQKQVNMLKELMSRINNDLHQHLVTHHVEYLQFAFRWMNNLLMRELPLTCIVRLWDTYLSESDGFASFHLYVCAALLNKFSQELLQENDFQGLMLYLKSLPTENWTSDDIKFLLAEGYRLKFAFADAPKHLTDNT